MEQGPRPIAMTGLVPICADLVDRRHGGDERHGRCHIVMPGAGPASTPGGVETNERRGWWACAHHDVEATGAAKLAPVGRVPGICASTAEGGWPGHARP